MKLRNKKTGEIVKVNDLNAFVHTDEETKIYTTLAELNEEWEDYEEPEGFYYIRCNGDVELDQADMNSEHGAGHKEIGNYFETREEAEKAVEKIKAWKRLKDKGFEFNGWYGGSKDIAFSIPQEIIDRLTVKDLNLLFCGGEDGD